MSRRKDGLSDIALRAFRYLRDAGGWYRPTELVAALKLDGGPQKTNCALAKALAALEIRDAVVRHPGQVDPRRPRYGVTARCVAPEGETLTPSATNQPEAS